MDERPPFLNGGARLGLSWWGRRSGAARVNWNVAIRSELSACGLELTRRLPHRSHLRDRLVSLPPLAPRIPRLTETVPCSFHWSCLISGPSETPFEGGIFEAELKFPRDYPLSPPKVRSDVCHEPQGF